jgi:predicted RNA-binding Zn ribbon-like protein
VDIASYGDHAIDLANTWSPNTDPSELMPDVAAARNFLRGRVAGADTADEQDLALLYEARERFRAVLTAPDDTTAVERLNALLRRHPVHPLVSGHDGGHWHLHLADDDRPPGELLVAGAAFGLAAWLLEAGMDRRGQCDAHDCDDVYVDTSRNHSRRYCSTTCSNRANVAAHRARQRAARADRD